MTPTDEELGRWQALADAATEGPWRYRDSTIIDAEGGHVVILWDKYLDPDNANFIAASREAVPRLIEALREERGLYDSNLLEISTEYRHCYDKYEKRITQLEAERDELRGEVERLRAEVTRLSTLGDCDHLLNNIIVEYLDRAKEHIRKLLTHPSEKETHNAREFLRDGRYDTE